MLTGMLSDIHAGDADIIIVCAQPPRAEQGWKAAAKAKIHGSNNSRTLLPTVENLPCSRNRSRWSKRRSAEDNEPTYETHVGAIELQVTTAAICHDNLRTFGCEALGERPFKEFSMLKSGM